jgi:hypothetical protein
LRLGLPKPKLAPYNLRMADQITTKLVGLIKDMKMFMAFLTQLHLLYFKTMW